MIPADMTRLIAELFAGRRVIVLISDSTTDHGTSTAAESTATTVAAVLGAPSDGEARAGQSSPLDVARQVEDSTPGVRWTAEEWSDRLGKKVIPARELRRAIQAGAITAPKRGKGRGHGALVIAPDAMVKYLVLRENGRHSAEGRPQWYEDVVKEARRVA